LAMIEGSRNGVDVTTLKSRTGLVGRKVNDIIYRLKKQGKIKNVARGIYIKA